VHGRYRLGDRPHLRVYGPLATGLTGVLFEGVPSYPVSTAIGRLFPLQSVQVLHRAHGHRALAKEGASWVEKHDISSLKLLGSVGERSTRRPGAGIMITSAATGVRSWIPGGRPKPAAI
jgi:hypothetical protein